jgi:uncharacterized protein YdaU (DUF1376 family)
MDSGRLVMTTLTQQVWTAGIALSEAWPAANGEGRISAGVGGSFDVMAKLPSMPFFPADFFADTAHMTGEAAAIYLVLLGHAWLRGGSLPDNNRLWGRLARISAQRWAVIKPEILPLWELGQDGLVRQKRLARDYEKVIKFIESKSKSGLKGNEKRWGKSLFENNDGHTANANGSRYAVRPSRDRNQNQNQKEESFNSGIRQKDNGNVYVKWDTPQWNAWEEFYRKNRRRRT